MFRKMRAMLGALGVVLIAISALDARAETLTILGKRFEVPAGWTLRSIQGGAAMWRAEEGEAPSSIVVLAPPFAYDGDLGLALGQLADLAAQNGDVTVDQRGEVQAATSDTNAALQVAFLPMLVSDKTGAQTLRSYIAVRSAGQVHLFQVTSSSADADQRTFAMLATFLDAVQYLPGPASAPPPQAKHDTGNQSGGNCHVVTRQQCMSQMMGAYPNMVPVYSCLRLFCRSEHQSH